MKSEAWFYEKPSKEGFYMVNYGDIVVDDNMQPAKVYKNKNSELMIEFFDGSIEKLKDINSGFKFLDIGVISKKSS